MMRAPARSSPGFVLVGVVMMVLALTILGLSLFSLSSYEAQFMNRSLDSEQAFQYAMGGLDRAAFALATAPDTLGMVKLNLPRENVEWARATQVRPGISPDTTGPLQWGGAPVTIEVEARYRGISRRVRGQYFASVSENYYKRLATIVGGIEVSNDIALHPLTGITLHMCGSVQLNGRMWEGNAPADSMAWTSCTNTYTPGIRCDVLPPVPPTTAFIGAHQAGALPPIITNPGSFNPTYRLEGTPGQVDYWYSNNAGFFSILEPAATPTISVRGRAVWLLTKGIRFDHEVHIVSNGDPDACLVIIAGKGTDPNYPAPGSWPDPSIWFLDGIRSDIPIVLVSNERVLIDRLYGWFLPFTCYADNVSIYAKNLFLKGPAIELVSRLRLQYGGAMDTQIDALSAAGALPNGATPSPLTLIPGSWRADP